MAETAPVPLPLSLFAAGEPAVDPGASFERHPLDDTCWVDIATGWLRGGDELLARLETDLPWKQGRRLMWGDWIDEPRLTCGVPLARPTTPPVLIAMAAELSQRYAVDFDSCFCNRYRGGADSVAWHADRDGKVQVDPLVAIVSLGGPRRFAMRPIDPQARRAGGSRSWVLHSGDLLVMGGSCQHRWEHAVPKTHHAPPRLSVTFRHQHRGRGAATAPSG